LEIGNRAPILGCVEGNNSLSTYEQNMTEVGMRPGDPLRTIKPIRSQKTGSLLPREGTFVSAVENLGRKLILVNFGNAGYEYLFPEEVLAESGNG
jgi:hypothetical protein